MSATNKTQHYNLPQFVAGDIPAWMTDVNNAMATIDGAIYDVASDEATVGESVAQLGSRVTTAENTVASLGTTVQGVQGDVAENTADIGTLEGNVNGLGTRMTAVEGRATAIEGDVDTVEGNLTANNKRFQFAYDSTEDVYGITIDGTFHPFGESTDIHDALWDALQYSGIVEESDTVDEMLAKLSDYYGVQSVVLINEMGSYNGSALHTDIVQWTKLPLQDTPNRPYISMNSPNNFAECKLLKGIKSISVPYANIALSVTFNDGTRTETSNIQANTAWSYDLSGWAVGTIIKFANYGNGYSYIDNGILATVYTGDLS